MIRKFQSICTSVLFVAIEIPAGNCYSGKMKSMDFKPHNLETPQNTSMKHVILIFDSKQRLEAQYCHHFGIPSWELTSYPLLKVPLNMIFLVCRWDMLGKSWRVEVPSFWLYHKFSFQCCWVSQQISFVRDVLHQSRICPVRMFTWRFSSVFVFALFFVDSVDFTPLKINGWNLKTPN